jgi:catechol 2,3-dioxygenase
MHSTIHPAVRVGHVHLRVADLDRALAFYRDGLGLAVTADGRRVGVDAVFLAAGDYHHHLALNTWQSAGGSAPPPGCTGLHHVAFLYPDRHELARAIQRLVDHGWPIGHATDHGGSVAVYLDDPDGNGVELTYDRPRSAWFDGDGRPVLRADPIDYRDLLCDLVPTPKEQSPCTPS